MLKKIYCLSICVWLYVDIYPQSSLGDKLSIAFPFQSLLHFNHFQNIDGKQQSALTYSPLLHSLGHLLSCSFSISLHKCTVSVLDVLWLMKVDIQLNSNVIGILN